MPSLPHQIIGHQRQQAELLADIAHGNISHAYLFTGAHHLGKFTMARWFAWRILADGIAPDQTETVKDQIERLIHPDFLSLDKLWMEDKQDDWKLIGQYSNVDQHHRAKDTPAKTDTIGIKDIEALQGRLYETGGSPHLCCVIRLAERMTGEAANAFLKVLEEPPPRVVFILTAESEQAVLPTIASRTRIVRFHPLKPSEMEPLLKESDEIDNAFILHLAQGAPGMLVTLLDDPDALRERRQIHGQAKQFWQAATLHDRLKWIIPFSDGKHDLKELLLHLGLTLREHPDLERREALVAAYMKLLRGLETNTNKGLLLERFALAVGVS